MKRPSKAIQHQTPQRRMLSVILATTFSFSLAALSVAATVSPVIAAESEATRAYDIPAGALDSALSRFAGEAGVVLSFEAEQAKHLATKGLKGNYSIKQGFDTLLQNSGLQAVEVQPGRFTLKPVSTSALQKSATDTLPEVKVAAQLERDGTTEGTGSYRAKYTSTATKLNLTSRETPQTISVVTRQQMNDFAMTSVDDALKAVSGVFVADEGSNGSLYLSRGFRMQSQYDGIPNPAGISDNNVSPQIENAFLDRIEVLQGASGLMSGAGTPGGTINLIRKRPTQEFKASAEVQLGSWDARRFVGDISTPLLESGRIRSRIVAVLDESNSFIDYVNRDRRGLYGIVEADLTEATTVSASLQYQEDKGRNHLGVPFAADGSESRLKRSSFLGDANNRLTKEYKLYTLDITHQFANDWRFKAAYMHGRTTVTDKNTGYISGDLDAVTGNGIRMHRMERFERETVSNAVDAYFSGPLTLWGRQHEFAFGINGSSKADEYYGAGYEAAIPINVYTFDPTSMGPVALGTPYDGKNKITQLGYYGVGRFALTDSLKLIAGLRVSEYKDKNKVSGITSSKETGVVTPYIGLIHDLSEEYSVYASYTDIFEPQSDRSVDGSTLKPIVGKNYETGIKGELFGKRLNLQAALFRLEQTNRGVADNSVPNAPGNACGGQCYTAAEKIVSRGLELNANGELSSGWNIATGYSYMHSEYAAGADKGERFMTYLPRHSIRLATSYKLPGTDWTIGGNVAGYSKMYRDDTSWTSGQPYTINRGGLVLVGLNAKYQISPKSELTFVASNLFDRQYRAHLNNMHYSTFGEPLKVMVNLKYQF